MQSPNNHIIYRCPSCSSRVSSNDTHCSVCGFELTPTSGEVERKTSEQPSSFRQAEAAPPPTKARDPVAASGPPPPITKPREPQAVNKPKEAPKTPWVRRDAKPNGQRLPWGVIGVSAMIVALMLGALALIRNASTPNPLITPVITFATGQPGTTSGTSGTGSTGASSDATRPASAFVVQATATLPPPTAVPTAAPTAVPPTPAPTAVPPTAVPTTAASSTQTQTQTVTNTAAAQPAAPAAPAAPAGPVIIDYIVQPNDTCTGIADRYRSSVSALYQYNTLNESCLIIIGARLKVPFNSRFPGAPVSAADIPNQTTLYIAQPNDTCDSIAAKFRIPVANLLKANGLNENCLITSGSRLQIPSTGAVEENKPAGQTQQARPSYGVPVPASPADRAVLSGLQDGITMQWQNLGTLRQDEWYVVSVQPTDGVNPLVYETKLPTLRITDAAILENATERTFIWVVQVKRVTATRVSGERVYENISPPSEPRRVTWRR